MRHAWVITRDFIADKDAPRGSYLNAPGVAGPRDAEPHEVALAKAGHLFRMLDGDGNVYYHGRLWAEDADNPRASVLRLRADGRPTYCTYGPSADEQAVFSPLDDFGRPNAGCVDIQYRCIDPEDPTKKVWASL